MIKYVVVNNSMDNIPILSINPNDRIKPVCKVSLSYNILNNIIELRSTIITSKIIGIIVDSDYTILKRNLQIHDTTLFVLHYYGDAVCGFHFTKGNKCCCICLDIIIKYILLNDVNDVRNINKYMLNDYYLEDKLCVYNEDYNFDEEEDYKLPELNHYDDENYELPELKNSDYVYDLGSLPELSDDELFI